ncbi:hypothetical protein AAVH_17407 [Aphelenchoides avenae]|nr:hypothetical protein AAVH_17407 [Aphelenchus avenae]
MTFTLPAMFRVVVFFFGVACTAFPTSEDGVQCFARCSLESSVRNASGDATHSMSVAEHKPGRSLFKRDVLSSPKSDDMCEPLPVFMKCSKSCPRSRLDAVVEQMIQLIQKECSESVSQEQREQFLQSVEDLYKKISDRATHCAAHEPDNDEALCKTIACLLGSALDELKADYPADVVTFVADAMKLMLALSLMETQSPPEACSILYEPYKA